MVPGRSAARVVIHPGRLTTLLEVHAATHPARVERRQDACSDPDGDEVRPSVPNAAKALLAALDAEGAEDELDDVAGADRDAP